MKFLVDAQLPRRLARLLESAGHEARHTLDLPHKNRTPDEDLRHLTRLHLQVLVTKDADFVDSFLVRGLPPKLLFVATGNITNDHLLALFRTNMEAIAQALAVSDFVEIDRAGLTVHA